MIITANAREIAALLSGFKDRILAKATKLTVANSLKLEGKTLAEVAAMGGGSSDSTDLEAAITEVAAELIVVPSLYSGELEVGFYGGTYGYVSSLLTGSSAVGAVTPSNIGTGIVHGIFFDPSTTPDTLMLTVEVDFADPATISEIVIQGNVLNTLNQATDTIPYNGRYIHQYLFVAAVVSSNFVDSVGSVFSVEIK